MEEALKLEISPIYGRTGSQARCIILHSARFQTTQASPFSNSAFAHARTRMRRFSLSFSDVLGDSWIPRVLMSTHLSLDRTHASSHAKNGRTECLGECRSFRRLLRLFCPALMNHTSTTSHVQGLVRINGCRHWSLVHHLAEKSLCMGVRIFGNKHLVDRMHAHLLACGHQLHARTWSLAGIRMHAVP